MDLERLFVDEEQSIFDAMEALEKVARKILLLVHGRKLVGVITDGDIRRWILKKGSLEAKIKEIANYSPLYLLEKDEKKALSFIKENTIEAVPIVDQDMNIITVVFWDEVSLCKKSPQISLPVVIMAGGKGTRLYPYTKILPKPLIPIGENPILEIIMDNFYKQGCSQFYTILNHKRNMIKAYFNQVNKQYEIHYIDEEIPLGTGGGLSLLKGRIKDTFILSNCDILIEEEFAKVYKLHKERKNIITMICSVQNFGIPYGTVEINQDGEIESFKEKPNVPFITNTGCYIVEPCVIEELEDNKKIGFPDIVEKYRHQKKHVGIYPISGESWMDMGQIKGMEDMSRRLGQEDID